MQGWLTPGWLSSHNPLAAVWLKGWKAWELHVDWSIFWYQILASLVPFTSRWDSGRWISAFPWSKFPSWNWDELQWQSLNPCLSLRLNFSKAESSLASMEVQLWDQSSRRKRVLGTLNSIIALQTSTNATSCVQDELSISSGSCIWGAEQNPLDLQLQEKLDAEAECAESWEHTAWCACMPMWRVALRGWEHARISWRSCLQAELIFCHLMPWMGESGCRNSFDLEYGVLNTASLTFEMYPTIPKPLCSPQCLFFFSKRHSLGCARLSPVH